VELVFLHEDEVTEFCKIWECLFWLNGCHPIVLWYQYWYMHRLSIQNNYHLLQHSYMFQSTYRTISMLSKTC